MAFCPRSSAFPRLIPLAATVVALAACGSDGGEEEVATAGAPVRATGAPEPDAPDFRNLPGEGVGTAPDVEAFSEDLLERDYGDIVQTNDRLHDRVYGSSGGVRRVSPAGADAGAVAPDAGAPDAS